MRIWSIHPRYLDKLGLLALWREGLLAQQVLQDRTSGYKHHPQLQRFKQHPFPSKMISNYLHFVCDEANNRHYKFDRSKINSERSQLQPINVTLGQLHYEWDHFLEKINRRAAELFQELRNLKQIDPHPIFNVIDGDIEEWERITNKKF